MKNPFRFGQLVKGENFCNREQELKDIKKAIQNGYSFWIYSPRRFGKTSLILKAFDALPEIKTIYLDLYNIQTPGEFAEKFSQVVLKELLDWKKGIKNIGQKLTTYFKNIIPKVSFDAMGNPSISLEPQVMEKKADLENILDIPEKLAAEKGVQVCVAFDEFQEVKRIEPFLINWMRSAFQRHENVSYVFLGSKQSLMETIFADSNSPFYEFGMKIPIHEILNEDWRVFIREKFDKTGLTITDTTIESILEKSGGHPHFTQYFASVVWEFVLEGADQEAEGFTGVWINRIIAGQSIIFQNLYDQLSLNQRKSIKAIACMEAEDRLYSGKYRDQYKLPASSTLAVTLKGLLQKEYIYKTGSTYKIVNPVFREWLKQL